MRTGSGKIYENPDAHKRTSARTKLAVVFVVVCIPIVIAIDLIFFAKRSDDHSYYAVSLIIVVLSMLPFALVFEGRKPKARELVVIAVMVAITVVGRAAFFMIPQFKPVSALVIITGAALGAESGFAVGALSGFVSNFIFGQGPWTPWQMFAFGIIGFLSGLIFSKMAQDIGGQSDTSRLGWNVRARRRLEILRIAVLCTFGGLITFILYGILLDSAAALMFTSGDLTKEQLILTYISGIPFNLIHAVSTIIFLAIFAKPLIEKLERLKKKYGLLGAEI